ncbi:MAG: site-specific integrase [Desulfobacterales bacterium]|nr:MAG: site-specific integrase [Desulfobacterales bacterium]
MGVKVREKPKGSGTFWVFINHNGKRKSKKIGDEKTANEVAEKIKAKLILGELKVEKINQPSPTFKECAQLWISLPHEWKESTKENYEFNLKLHAYPVFGKRRIDEIKRKDFKVYFDNLLIKGLTRSTVALIKAPINGVFSYAVESELIENNPLNELKLTHKKRNFKVEPLNEAEVNQLLEHAKIFMDGYYYPHMLCALRTGLRIGELKALKWKDIDFEKRQIEVKRSCRNGRVTGTKNDKWRRVDMTPHLTETLKELRTYQKKLALKYGRQVSEWVFASRKGNIFDSMTFKNALNQCLKAAGLRKIRVHDLRHTYATIRLMRGHNVGDVSYQLGHSSIKMTYDVYAHWIPGHHKSEVDDLDNLHPNAPYTHPAKME